MDYRRPHFQCQAERVKDHRSRDRDNDLQKFYNEGTFEDLERVFRCDCVFEPRQVGAPQRRSGKVDAAFFADMCPELADNYVIYGKIGQGTFGTIYAAHSVRRSPTEPVGHFAIKIQSYKTSLDRNTTELAFREFSGRDRYTHKEAFILSFLTDCECITHVHSAGIHKEYAYIIMDMFSVDLDGRDLDNAPAVTKKPKHARYKAYTGEHCTSGMTPRLDELQSRKVATQLVEALMFINDRGIIHLDMSQRNFLIDSNLNAQLIDFGDCKLVVTPEDRVYTVASTLYGLESMTSPELLLAINRNVREGYQPPPRKSQKDYYHPSFTGMDEQLWRFGCMVFELLHGHAPFAALERLDRQYIVNFQSAELFDPLEGQENLDREDLQHNASEMLIEQRNRRYRRQRRDRIMNDPLQFQENIVVESGELVASSPATEGSDDINEVQEFSSVDQQLSQDCVDVLEAMFRKDHETRPTLEELVTFPWFQGAYLDTGYEFRRPPRAAQKWRTTQPKDTDPRPTDSPLTKEMEDLEDEMRRRSITPKSPVSADFEDFANAA